MFKEEQELTSDVIKILDIEFYDVSTLIFNYFYMLNTTVSSRCLQIFVSSFFNSSVSGASDSYYSNQSTVSEK